MKPYLADPAAVKELIRRFDFTVRKGYGQNFLIDPSVPEAITRIAALTKDDYVLEIGPGIGTMTQYLSEAAAHVTAVEIDRHLEPILSETLRGADNVEIIWNDILKVDLSALPAGPTGRLKVVANLPYYITTPILMALLKEGECFESITVMVQEEVAERIVSGPGSKEYGAISLGVLYYAEPALCLRVPAGAFLPQPKVASAVLHLKKREEPAVECRDPDYMFTLIRAAFMQRRKTLVNGLSASAAGVGKGQTAAALAAMGLSPMARGETLTLEQFAALSDLLKQV
ncbi:MAG: 16S rRNA (adenine(1518)-N(6)/adenine(1519)-N(6))-dimethyltransferase RsmA [Lachnospiraceae bacterium]|nr:16S rRNA (adenine(1518)-N(6)/adenine(1519)-N(6))-dimethyltransferase RsmA [Lachnospiraceae bacterium]